MTEGTNIYIHGIRYRIRKKYLRYKGLIHALTILAEPTLSAHLVDKDLFAVASEDLLETQTAGECK